jgi:hypothetical protein
MMRQPTPEGAEYEWHRRALAGERPPIHENEVHAGFFKMKRVKGGPWIAVKIELIRPVDPETGELIADEYLRAEVGGTEVTPESIWVSCCARPITKEDFDYLTGVTRWDMAYAPGNPYANPTRKVDHLKTPLAF